MRVPAPRNQDGWLGCHSALLPACFLELNISYHHLGFALQITSHPRASGSFWLRTGGSRLAVCNTGSCSHSQHTSHRLDSEVGDGFTQFMGLGEDSFPGGEVSADGFLLLFSSFQPRQQGTPWPWAKSPLLALVSFVHCVPRPDPSSPALSLSIISPPEA